MKTKLLKRNGKFKVFDTQVLAFDDVKKNFEFEQLFSIITEGITINRKKK